ncbi:LAMI_0H11386g1_1 [Lachancea mirantina]|uniref:LAMI_0H11386g1_1 n=1 Tax=Lachancea mirantina TaxID=1230905 RepID=A0A1G4KH56_9SACH|nr:LAMI_0H11386g1_1 [Lachancea mirantina]
MSKSWHLDIWPILTKVSCSLTCFACGTIAISLICLDKETQALNHASLILQICGLFVAAIIEIPLTLEFWHLQKISYLAILLRMVTYASAVWYWVDLVNNMPVEISTILRRLVTAHLALLLAVMGCCGASLTSGHVKRCKKDENVQDEELADDHFVATDDNFEKQPKGIALKNSAQTLTPAQENVILAHLPQPNWMNNSPATYSSSDTYSTPSVKRHAIDTEAFGRTSLSPQGCEIGKPKHINGINKSPKLNLLTKIRHKRSLKRAKTVQDQPRESDSSGAHYVTRLSTIHDTSRSLVNVFGGPQNRDSLQPSAESVLMLDHQSNQEREQKDETAITIEKNALERLNSALLPPSLRTHAFTESEQAPELEQPSDDHANLPNLFANDLQKIPEMFQNDGINNLGDPAIILPRTVTLDDWKTQKSLLLDRERHIAQSGDQLLPGLDFKVNDSRDQEKAFSFPDSYSMKFKSIFPQLEPDTIEQLDDLFKSQQSESKKVRLMKERLLLEDVLRQDNGSETVLKLSKESTFPSGPHSPTKSIASSNTAATPHKSPSRLGSILLNSASSFTSNHALHSRSNSQLSGNAYSLSNQGSPVKSLRFRRSLSKKLSLSSISTRHDDFVGSLADEYYYGRGHGRGKSIDFSYVHSLQSKHSPSKSTSLSGRRNSMFILGDRAPPAINMLRENFTNAGRAPFTSENTTTTSAQDVTILEDESDESNCSKGSGVNYPSVIKSEYDREKWSTLMSLDMIHPV